jgi:hypothetical protein
MDKFTVKIKALCVTKLDNIISQDMDIHATVPDKDPSNDLVDIVVNDVKAVVVCVETVTFIFSDGNMFVANITQNDYYKIEVS